ncbi:MAG: flagellar export chaperone FlgN [Spirochaetaceae bacterium]|jgi:DNA repair exonuclease SbcCD ATPase subunit|nr:flagellar export chaperone FlgN [Spirochaetaceae bacterium]
MTALKAELPQELTKQELSSEELNERVAILKRFRELLEQQRAKFREYLKTLELQQDVIASGDMEAMTAYTELEEHIVSNIYTIQKVIDPMEAIYRSACPDAELRLPEMKKELTRIQERVMEQNRKNRELLTFRMTALRQQIASVRNPYTKRSSIYSTTSHSAGIIDITQ